jgi:hypothetical protein
LALQERYIQVASSITGRLQHPGEKHDLTVENPDPLSEWRDKDGTTHLRSRVCIPEDDLWKAGKARAEKKARESARADRPILIGTPFAKKQSASRFAKAISINESRAGIVKRASKSS